MGITRIHILSDWGNTNERVQMSRDLEHSADSIYYEIFNGMGMQLDEGLEIIECTKREAMARYDYKEGIDCILNFANGHRATVQEKLLDKPYNTITFTERQKNGNPGNWYTCTAQYWLTAYAKNYHNDPADLSYRSWMLVDFPLLKRLDAIMELPWVFKDNNNPKYRGIIFRYLDFGDVPEDCIVAESHIGINQLVLDR
jgi:hypothetical protein